MSIDVLVLRGARAAVDEAAVCSVMGRHGEAVERKRGLAGGRGK